jgi:hypothetical protein
LAVQVEPTGATQHFTEVDLTHLHRLPQTKTIDKIKRHLRGIYRQFLRNGSLQLEFDGESLTFEEVPILKAPYYKTPDAEPVEWKKSLDFDFGLGLRAHGFAALRATASTSEAGFALFRRDRLILGSADDGYRPELIFGKSNSYRYQRLFGELHLEGFEVTHTKDGFRWNEYEDVFLEFLKDRLDDAPLPLLEQAEQHRVRPRPADVKPAAEQATEHTAAVIEREAPPILTEQVSASPEPSEPTVALSKASATAACREISVEVRGAPWLIQIELTTDPAIGDWVSVSEDQPPRAASSPRRLGVRLNLAHPFMERFGGTQQEQIEPLLRVAAAIALAQTTARASGVKQAGVVLRNVNEFLRDALSKP